MIIHNEKNVDYFKFDEDYFTYKIKNKTKDIFPTSMIKNIWLLNDEMVFAELTNDNQKIKAKIDDVELEVEDMKYEDEELWIEHHKGADALNLTEKVVIRMQTTADEQAGYMTTIKSDGINTISNWKTSKEKIIIIELKHSASFYNVKAQWNAIKEENKHDKRNKNN